MNTKNRERWSLELDKLNGSLKKPSDLLRRAASSEDFLDSAIIGGVALGDIITGKIAESQIPSQVIEAFHSQYPQYGSSFVDAVHDLAHDPDKLMGLVNGVKGKLFEIDYADWLNHGHLPSGWTAELAHHANNPSWDIVIHDADGHVDGLLQLKATESLEYVRDAIASHPNIDVVVPHDVYQSLVDHPDIFGHLADGHETLSSVNGHVMDAVGHAESAGASHLPVIGPAIVIGLAVLVNGQSYRKGAVSMGDAVRNVVERGSLSILASVAGWITVAATHEPFVGLPVAVITRLLGGQAFHNKRRRELLTEYVENVVQSRTQLSLKAHTLLLGAAE